MKIFRDKTDYDGTVVALGNFDGLHNISCADDA